MTDDRASIYLLAGPTASGKSAKALEWAEKHNGTVLNADSMQLYADVPILTARPSAAETARAPHRLYGHLAPTETWSAGEWLRAALPHIDAATPERPLCIVGGTGLYFNALVYGLADIPDITEDNRRVARDTYDSMSEASFREILKQYDPRAEARIKPNDRQRLCRAYEVWLETGTALSDWQAQTRPALAEGVYALEILRPERDWLYTRCDARLEAMLAEGALDEVRALMAKGLQPEWPIMRVLGLGECVGYLKGELSFDRALARAQQATRNYAKRQTTWFRNQFH
jgi:tRNA dimethylallyltransferase